VSISLVLCICKTFQEQNSPPTFKRTTAVTVAPTIKAEKADGDGEYSKNFETVWNTVDKTFYDPGFGGLDWLTVHDEYNPRIEVAADDQTFYLLLNQMLRDLSISHIGVGPVETGPSVEPVVWAKGKTGIDLRLLNNQAVFTWGEAGLPVEQAGLQTGYIIQSIERIAVEQILAAEDLHLTPPSNEQSLIDQLTRKLLSRIYGEPGTCVILTFRNKEDELGEKCIERIQRPRTGCKGEVLTRSYLKFEHQWLQSNLGYIRFNIFLPDLVPELAKAVAEMQDAPGIFIDLRGNPGGNPFACEQMAAQSPDTSILFGSFKPPVETVRGVVEGQGTYFNPLVILIEALSLSGSEYFASGMQELGRALTIGEKSMDRTTGMDAAILQNGILLGYPVAQLLTKGDMPLEEIGIFPDIPVSLERDLLLSGIDAQLQAAINLIMEQN
jgi:carboxyl-terminal processing protease